MAVAQSLRRDCPIAALQTGQYGERIGNTGNDDAAGVTEDRPGEGAEEGKAITTSEVSAEVMDNIAQA